MLKLTTKQLDAIERLWNKKPKPPSTPREARGDDRPI